MEKMKKKILAIGIALCIALAVAIPVPIDAHAAGEGGFVVQPTPVPAPAAKPGATQAGGVFAEQPAPTSPVTIRVNFVDFTYTMPSGRTPGPFFRWWYMDSRVFNADGKKIALGRSAVFCTDEKEVWQDLVIRKNIPKRGDKVTIRLDARTYASGTYIDISPEEPMLKLPDDPTGRRLTIDYVVGTEQEGWGTGREWVLADWDGNLHYKIETLGLPVPTPTPTPPPVPTPTPVRFTPVPGTAMSVSHGATSVNWFSWLGNLFGG